MFQITDIWLTFSFTFGLRKNGACKGNRKPLLPLDCGRRWNDFGVAPSPVLVSRSSITVFQRGDKNKQTPHEFSETFCKRGCGNLLLPRKYLQSLIWHLSLHLPVTNIYCRAKFKGRFPIDLRILTLTSLSLLTEILWESDCRKLLVYSLEFLKVGAI